MMIKKLIHNLVCSECPEYLFHVKSSWMEVQLLRFGYRVEEGFKDNLPQHWWKLVKIKRIIKKRKKK